MIRINKPHWGPNRTWKYPETAAVLNEVGLYHINHYVEVRRQTIASFIINRPIFDYCMGGERKRGTGPHQWWWEQPMDLDTSRAVAAVAAAGVDVSDECLVVGMDNGGANKSGYITSSGSILNRSSKRLGAGRALSHILIDL